MTLFLLIFIGVYSSMHGYAIWKVRQAWPDSRLALLLAVGWALLMMGGPFLARGLDRAGLYGPQRVASAVGYTWCVIVFWIVATAFLLDTWNVGIRLVALARPGARAYLAAPRLQIGIILGLVSFASLWGLVEGRMVRVRRVVVPTERLAPGSSPIRVVQLSDLHVNWYVRAPMLERVVKMVNAEKPDVLVSTGDMIDVSWKQVQEETAVLSKIRAPMGKFAVTGNHEFYLSLDDALKFHEKSGLRMLRGESVEVAGGRLRIVGVDDPAGRHRSVKIFTDATDYLPARGASRPFTIVLKHQPKVRDKALGRFDLQLSGHTHGGQVFPFYIFVRMLFRYGPGMHELEGGSRLWVTRGVGLWGPPMRVLAPPEIVVLDIVPEKT